jgi:hypothetical protein
MKDRNKKKREYKTQFDSKKPFQGQNLTIIYFEEFGLNGGELGDKIVESIKTKRYER